MSSHAATLRELRQLRNDLEKLRRKQQGYYTRSHHLLDVRIPILFDLVDSLVTPHNSIKEPIVSKQMRTVDSHIQERIPKSPGRDRTTKPKVLESYYHRNDLIGDSVISRTFQTTTQTEASSTSSDSARETSSSPISRHSKESKIDRRSRSSPLTNSKSSQTSDESQLSRGSRSSKSSYCDESRFSKAVQTSYYLIEPIQFNQIRYSSDYNRNLKQKKDTHIPQQTSRQLARQLPKHISHQLTSHIATQALPRQLPEQLINKPAPKTNITEVLSKEEIFRRYKHLRPTSQSLQDIFRIKCPGFIKRSEERVQAIKQRSQMRKLLEEERRKKFEYQYEHKRQCRCYYSEKEYAYQNSQFKDNFRHNERQLYNQESKSRNHKTNVQNFHRTNSNHNQVGHTYAASSMRDSKRFSYSEMKRQTSKIYNRLPEVVAKKKEIETDKNKAFIRQRYASYISRIRANTLHNVMNYPLHYEADQFL